MQPFTQAREEVANAIQRPRRGHTCTRLSCDLEIFAYAQAGKHTAALRHEADALARNRFRRQPSDRLAKQTDFTLTRRQKANDRTHTGGFAGTIASQQSQHAPAIQGKRDLMQHVAVAIERIDS